MQIIDRKVFECNIHLWIVKISQDLKSIEVIRRKYARESLKTLNEKLSGSFCLALSDVDSIDSIYRSILGEGAYSNPSAYESNWLDSLYIWCLRLTLCYD